MLKFGAILFVALAGSAIAEPTAEDKAYCFTMFWQTVNHPLITIGDTILRNASPEQMAPLIAVFNGFYTNVTAAYAASGSTGPRSDLKNTFKQYKLACAGVPVGVNCAFYKDKTVFDYADTSTATTPAWVAVKPLIYPILSTNHPVCGVWLSNNKFEAVSLLKAITSDKQLLKDVNYDGFIA